MTRDAPQVSGITEEMRERAKKLLAETNKGAAVLQGEESGQIFVQKEIAIQAVAAALSAQWMPIEAAPKDGTTILAWSPYSLEPATVRWSERKEWVAVWDGASVIDHQSDFGTEYKTHEPVTHWQPLPTPPTTAQEG